jgi:hypothetical protein
VNETVEIGPWGAIGTLLAVLGTIIGLVVWLVKANMKRQEAVTDRSISFMEKQLDIQAATHKIHAEAIGRMATASDKMADAVNQNTNELKRFTRAHTGGE